jgi:hypothetical protein
MDLKAHYTFDAPLERVWDLLMDPHAIGACIPGCHRFAPAGKDRYRVVLNAAVAAVSGSFEGTVVVKDKHPPHSYRLLIDASGKPGFAKGESTVTLVPEGTRVRVDVVATMTVGGLVAQVGQRLMGGTARLMMDRFFKCLQSKV